MASTPLQDILAHAETLNLPDGEYLVIANALNKAFHSISSNQWVTFTTDSPNLITLNLDNGHCNSSIQIQVQSVSANNIKEQRPTTYKIDMVIQIKNKDNPAEIKTQNICYHTMPRPKNKFEVLFDLYNPKTVKMKCENIEFSYDCNKFLTDLREQCIAERKINNEDEDDCDCDCKVSDNMFRTEMRFKFIELCRSWFWEKYNDSGME